MLQPRRPLLPRVGKGWALGSYGSKTGMSGSRMSSRLRLNVLHWTPHLLRLTHLLSHPVRQPQAGANAQHDHSTALRFAATWGNEEAVAALLAAGADPRAQWGAALLTAAKYGHAGVVQQLLEGPALEAPPAHTGLHLARSQGRVGICIEWSWWLLGPTQSGLRRRSCQVPCSLRCAGLG